MVKHVASQNYPRIQNEKDSFCGFLDDSKLQPHVYKMAEKELHDIIISAIIYANKKSSRAILHIPDKATEADVGKIYVKEGKELFKYFQKYCGDPASTAYSCYGKHYTIIAQEQFRNRTLQKERMNSGWRYQFIAKDGANHSKRFISVSDIGTNEADFNATIKVHKYDSKVLNIYVSVKNRVNTMGGQDWPKAIRALEEVAKTDKNRNTPYICIFGIAMDKGTRIIKNNQKTGSPYSSNTEIWQSDYFWPFFTNHTYEEIAKAVLNVLIIESEPVNLGTDVPEELVESFGKCCKEYELLDKKGCFNDSFKLVELFVNSKNIKRKHETKKKR